MFGVNLCTSHDETWTNWLFCMIKLHIRLITSHIYVFQYGYIVVVSAIANALKVNAAEQIYITMGHMIWQKLCWRKGLRIGKFGTKYYNWDNKLPSTGYKRHYFSVPQPANISWIALSYRWLHSKWPTSTREKIDNDCHIYDTLGISN